MKPLRRRDFLKAVGLGSLALGGMGRASAQAIHDGSRIVDAITVSSRGEPAFLEDGKVIQPKREIRVLRDTDVLVVGGGTAGVVAALAARRAGARVTLVERYGCFGGLWTAGLVLIVLSTHVRSKSGHTKMVRGIGDEVLARIAKCKYGAIDYGADSTRDATTDPEVTKVVLASMLREAGVDILLHSWVTNAIMEKDAVKGVLFESKAGCLAVRAKVVVDASGDGDVLDAAGAATSPRRSFVPSMKGVGPSVRPEDIERMARMNAMEDEAGRADRALGLRAQETRANLAESQAHRALQEQRLEYDRQRLARELQEPDFITKTAIESYVQALANKQASGLAIEQAVEKEKALRALGLDERGKAYVNYMNRQGQGGGGAGLQVMQSGDKFFVADRTTGTIREIKPETTVGQSLGDALGGFFRRIGILTPNVEELKRRNLQADVRLKEKKLSQPEKAKPVNEQALANIALYGEDPELKAAAIQTLKERMGVPASKTGQYVAGQTYDTPKGKARYLGNDQWELIE